MAAKTKLALVFDDGFARSTIATADIFERFGLRATFAVLADTRDFTPGCGDFALWTELQSRGHRIHPHGHTHLDLSTLPLAKAQSEIETCLQIFAENLPGFSPRDRAYHFAYNRASPELCHWLLHEKHFGGVRIGGTGFLSDADLAARVWPSAGDGPHDPFDDLWQRMDRCRELEPPALFYTLHGLDGQEWGAMTSDHLRQILDRIVTSGEFDYWPVP